MSPLLRTLCVGWTSVALSHGAPLVSPPKAILEQALAAPITKGAARLSSGSGQALLGPLPETLALAARAGDTTADARLLEQLRATINGKDSPLCVGWYPSQIDLRQITTLAIVRHTPRIWDPLTDEQKARCDAVMKAALVANAYMVSEKNPDVLAARAPGASRALRGEQANLRGFRGHAYFAGGNIRTGMSGNVIAGVAYFGPVAAADMLESYDHAAFTAELGRLGLTNPHDTFAHRDRGIDVPGGADGLSANAPSGETIERALQGWSSRGAAIPTIRKLVIGELNHSFGKTVSSGLNHGEGATNNPARGKIIEPWPRPLPRAGEAGMLFEFDTRDAKGERSSSAYATKTLRNALDILICADLAGLWHRDGAEERALIERIDVGVADWDFKMRHGYHDFAHDGTSMTFDLSYSLAGEKWQLPVTRSLWADTIRSSLAPATTLGRR